MAVTVNFALDEPEWAEFSRVNTPVAPSFGTVTFAWVSLMTLTPASRAAPIQAEVTAVKPVPARVVTVPTAPEVGVKDLITGVAAVAELTVSSPKEKAAWSGLSTAIWPPSASAGTVSCTCVSLMTFTVASCAYPIHALLRPVNPLPFTVTTPPIATVVGVKLDTVG